MQLRVLLVAAAIGLAACSSDGAIGPIDTATMSPTTEVANSATSTATLVATTEPTPHLEEVLVFHKTEGFRHASIEAGIEAIENIAGDLGFEVTATDDAATFTDDGLSGFDVVVFLNTTGDVLDEAQQTAMEAFIGGGKGFVGIHSATDTEYDWTWYGGLIGTYFQSHPEPQPATVRVIAPSHPTMQGLPASFQRFDEWYNFAGLPGPDVEILATLDESTYTGGEMGDLHPVMWAHEFGGGRSWYTAFGHTVESFSEPLLLELLASAIRWAAYEL